MNEQLDEIIDFIENYAVSASSADFDKTKSRKAAKAKLQRLMLKEKIDVLESTNEWIWEHRDKNVPAIFYHIRDDHIAKLTKELER